MTDVLVIEGEALDRLRWLFTGPLDRHLRYRGDVRGIYRVRITYDDDGIKIKVNEGAWSPPLPSPEPEPGMTAE